MAKLNRDSLKTLRGQKKKECLDDCNSIRIIVGKGTCGIAAGANQTYDAFAEEIKSREVSGVKLMQSGCMGYCANEPTVSVKMPGMPDTIYGNVDDKIARKIIDRHVINGRLVNDHVFDKPSIDIISI